MRHMLILDVLAVTMWTADVANAHSKLKSSVPTNGATVPATIKEVRLDFMEPIEPALSRFGLSDAGGKSLQTAKGADACEGKTCRFAIGPLQPGKYQVNYHVLSADGHVVDGHFGFTVTSSP